MQDFTLGDTVVRPSLNTIETGDEVERLPAKVIDVLVALSERPGEVWAKADLFMRVWGDATIGDDALPHAVWLLRKALRDDPKQPRFIETIPRRGYRLLMPIGRLAPPAAGQASDADTLTDESARSDRDIDPLSAALVSPIAPGTASPSAADTQPSRRAQFIRVNRLGVLLAMLLLAVLTWSWHASTSHPSTPADSEIHAASFQTGGPLFSLAPDADGSVLVGSEDGFLYALDVDAHERWRATTGSRWASAALANGGKLYYGSGDGFIYVLDAKRGVELRRQSLGPSMATAPVLIGDLLLVGDKDGHVSALQVDQLAVRWQSSLGSDIVGALLPHAGRILAQTERGEIAALDPADGRIVWQRRFAGPLSRLVAIGGTAIVFASESGFITALDAGDGTTLWQIDLQGAGTTPVFDGQRLYAVGRFGALLALRPNDGALLWRQDFDAGERLDPVLLGAELVIGIRGQRLAFYDGVRGARTRLLVLPASPLQLLANADALWIATNDARVHRLRRAELRTGELHMDAGQTPSPPPTAQAIIEPMHQGIALPELQWQAMVTGNAQDATPAATGLSYIGDESGVVAFDAQGHELWRYALALPIGSAITVAGDRLLFGGRDRFVHVLDAGSGALQWRFATGDAVLSTPVVVGDRVYVGSADHRLYALQLADGRLLWSFEAGGEVRTAAAVAEGLVVFGSTDEKVYALDADSGALRWRYQAADWVVAQAVINDGRVFVGIANGDFVALSLQRGEEQWLAHSDGGKVWFAPALSHGKVYFGSGDGHVYALLQSDGSEAWRYRTGADAAGSVIERDGVVYAGSRDAHLYALDAESGLPLWRLRTGGWVWNPGLAGDRLLVPSADQHVYALKL